ncbi:CFEM-domain-containing protein [Alternaria alternata]|uniref:CFEM-domain-containing protein n=1 Tax=Alternaria alternata TaxID=5599 RepID=A0A177DRV9_ALTAL|nr:CFEM-domain-containing protein [Alternaria alternata]OAG22266.1 CFEM-domain-containing protein [Alternaria alternata]
MKTFTIATIVALASVGAAQLDNIPSCALNCFVGPLTSDGCSSLTDFACHCKKGAQLLSQVQPCVQGACGPSDQAAAIAAVESTCSAAGAPISIPDASAPAASSAVASATSAAAASAASSMASSMASEASSVLSEASSAVASAASSMSSEMSMSESMSMTATPTATGSMSMTPSASMSEFTGGAAQATQAVGILGAAALAMFAL